MHFLPIEERSMVSEFLIPKALDPERHPTVGASIEDMLFFLKHIGVQMEETDFHRDPYVEHAPIQEGRYVFPIDPSMFSHHIPLLSGMTFADQYALCGLIARMSSVEETLDYLLGIALPAFFTVGNPTRVIKNLIPQRKSRIIIRTRNSHQLVRSLVVVIDGRSGVSVQTMERAQAQQGCTAFPLYKPILSHALGSLNEDEKKIQNRFLKEK